MLIQLPKSATLINTNYITHVKWEVNTTYSETKINDPKEVLTIHIHMTNNQVIELCHTEDIFKLIQSIPEMEWPNKDTFLMEYAAREMKRANERYDEYIKRSCQNQSTLN